MIASLKHIKGTWAQVHAGLTRQYTTAKMHRHHFGSGAVSLSTSSQPPKPKQIQQRRVSHGCTDRDTRWQLFEVSAGCGGAQCYGYGP
jgi:hypothetical protein